jgi:perosamine synthetase
MDSIISIAKKYNLKVIEDCAEAHGSTYKGRKVGSFGDIGCFSFYGNKVITTGEGGMCTTNNSRYNSVMRVLRDHGMSKSKKYWHDHVGYNYRMTNLQAAIGLAQLERIDEIHKNRFACEKLYRNLLKNNGFDFQKIIPGREKITWLVSATVESNRDQVLNLLKKLGVDARPFFFSLSAMTIYEKYAFNENTISKKISKSGLNFPTYGDLNNLNKMDKILEEFLLETPDWSS